MSLILGHEFQLTTTMHALRTRNFSTWAHL